MSGVIISSFSSNSGKTLVTTALLHHFKNEVRAFKVGPDYIDPLYHQAITKTPSINLDNYLMNEEQIKWLYNNYKNKINIIEGVMGFYDGSDKGSSAYNIAKVLNLGVILVVDGSGTYLTLSPLIKGIKEHKKDSNIKGVIINKVSSSMHYTLIKKDIEENIPDIKVLGFILKDLEIFPSKYLGLNIQSLEHLNLNEISSKVLENINIDLIKEICKNNENIKNVNYPFEDIPEFDKTIGIVNDRNFAFLYHDNIKVLETMFKKVIFIDSNNDEIVPDECDILYIPGGYVEDDESYKNIKDSNSFKNSVIRHFNSKHIYAECAGMLYLSNNVNNKKMLGLIDVDFTLENKRVRLGYYENNDCVKGHAFHYTKPTSLSLATSKLFKNNKGEYGTWEKPNIYASYLHIMFRNNITTLLKYLGIKDEKQ